MDHYRDVDALESPSDLFWWSVHVPEDNDRCSGNEKWPLESNTPPFEKRLRDSFEHNDFSPIKEDQLPMAISRLAKTAQRTANELLEEALGFAIMARNPDLLDELLNKVSVSVIDLSRLSPYHLAATYLDRSRSCCKIMELLCFRIGNLPKLDINNHGHTVLDSLMITILRNHTYIKPELVDDALKKEQHFPGQEVDICGRWDADSKCYRAMLSAGQATVPFTWKHKFCHTSIHMPLYRGASISFPRIEHYKWLVRQTLFGLRIEATAFTSSHTGRYSILSG